MLQGTSDHRQARFDRPGGVVSGNLEGGHGRENVVEPQMVPEHAKYRTIKLSEGLVPSASGT